jgi:flagellar basal-body rod protein FlgG
MYNVLNVSKSGLKAMQYNMDATADDIANINTNGYKSKKTSFQELINNDEINAGSKCAIGKINFKAGNLIESPFDYHMAISGEGFFGVIDENNNLMLTRNGSFHMNGNYTITDDNGYPLVAEYYTPIEEWGDNINISANGEITDEKSDEMILGKVILFKPQNLDSLVSLGEGRYLPSGNVELLDSMENDEVFGDINQHFLEASNVDIIESLADMISTQRAYSLNAKAIQTTDDIMGLINDIKR